jgi:beta-galactosidase
MSRAKVYLNGAYIGEWPYIPLSFELTKQIQYGKENILSVRLENKEESSRWYPGAGTEMRLVKRSSSGGALGTYITTPIVSTQRRSEHQNRD